MLFLEASARAWLILHAVVGASVVAATTHLVIWTRTWWRGDYRRHQAARWFATTAFVLYVAQFAIGNLLYPVYKVRVRAEYLDEPAAVRADVAARTQSRADTQRRWGEGATSPPAAVATADTTKVAKAFDVKEHWIALGLALAAGALIMTWAWDPRRADGSSAWLGGRLVCVLASGSAICAWIGALVGFWVSSFRAVG